MTAEKLAIDPLYPLMPCSSPDGRLGQALSGQVYCNAYAWLITQPYRQHSPLLQLVPIVPWIVPRPAKVRLCHHVRIYTESTFAKKLLVTWFL